MTEIPLLKGVLLCFRRWCRRVGLLSAMLFSLGLSVAEGHAADGMSDGESGVAGEEGGEGDLPLLARGMEMVAEHHATISSGIVTSAAWVDSFFDDGRLDVEAQQTRLKVVFSLLADERQGLEFDTRANFRLSLPMLSKRLQLHISDDGDEETALDPSRNPWPPREIREKGVLAGVRYFFTQKAKRNTSIKASVRLRDGAPSLLLEPRYRQDFTLAPWLFRFTQRVIAYSDGDLQLRTIFNLERPLPEWPDELVFRAVAEGIWFRDRSGYFYHIDLRLLQKLSARQSLEYTWTNEFQTVPAHRLDVTRGRVAYRQNLHWDWLFLEVAPQLSFSYDRDWQPDIGILLNLEVIFGACENL